MAFLLEADVPCLRDGDEQSWRKAFTASGRRDSNGQACCYAHQRVADLAARRRLGGRVSRATCGNCAGSAIPGNLTLDFDAIAQPWLRELAKRWTRQRMATGARARGRPPRPDRADPARRLPAPGAASTARAAQPGRAGALPGRPAATDPTGHRRQVHIGQLNAFLAGRPASTAGTTGCPTAAAVLHRRQPPPPERLPRAAGRTRDGPARAPATTSPAGTDPAEPLITLILIRCGLRSRRHCRLSLDCIVTDAEGAPYLRYVNHKMKREALVPIDEELHAPDPTNSTPHRRPAQPRSCSPARRRTPTAPAPTEQLHLPRAALPLARTAATSATNTADRVHLTPHQWRHTLGTRLINRDVPQEVVRRILDHDSSQMTAHYARLHDTTVRRHWEAARKVDITGATVTVDPDGPLAEAAWTKQRLAARPRPCPTGYCGLPIQKTCPHANACLTCPMFLTTAEFLPAHREHRHRSCRSSPPPRPRPGPRGTR